MTGEIGTDASDAAASGIFNMRERAWADEVIERLRFQSRFSPRCAFLANHRYAKQQRGQRIGSGAREFRYLSDAPISLRKRSEMG